MAFMTYPMIGASVDMWCIRMSRLVPKIAPLRRCRFAALILLRFGSPRSGRSLVRAGCRAVPWNITMSNVTTFRRVSLSGMPTAWVFVSMLPKRHRGLQKKRNRKG